MFSFIHINQKPQIIREARVGVFNRKDKRHNALRGKVRCVIGEEFIITKDFLNNVSELTGYKL